MTCGQFPRLLYLAFAGLLAIMPGAVQAQGRPDMVRITNLSDVVFGSITNFTVDSVRNQNVCVYVRSPDILYEITATGSGVGGAFTLGSGGNVMPYEVQWAASPGQTIGTPLSPGLPLTNQPNPSPRNGCGGSGPSTTASLITIVRATAVGLAKSGSYNGTLSLLIAPN